MVDTLMRIKVFVWHEWLVGKIRMPNMLRDWLRCHVKLRRYSTANWRNVKIVKEFRIAVIAFNTFRAMFFAVVPFGCVGSGQKGRLQSHDRRK